MSNRLADNISPALMAELDQTAADISRPGVAAALRRLADEVEQA